MPSSGLAACGTPSAAQRIFKYEGQTVVVLGAGQCRISLGVHRGYGQAATRALALDLSGCHEARLSSSMHGKSCADAAEGVNYWRSKQGTLDCKPSNAALGAFDPDNFGPPGRKECFVHHEEYIVYRCGRSHDPILK